MGFAGFEVEAGGHAIVADEEQIALVSHGSRAIGGEFIAGPEPGLPGAASLQADREAAVLKAGRDRHDDSVASRWAGNCPAVGMRDLQSSANPNLLAGGRVVSINAFR